MKKFLTLCCAILGMGATMYGASADLSDYLTPGEGGSETTSSFTITTNEDGTLTFSGSYTDTTEGQSNNSYSVSFDIVAEANKEEGEETTYTVTMSNFAISGSLSSAFSSLNAKITGITQVDLYLLDSTSAIYTKTGNGLGGREWTLTEFIGYFDKYSNAVSFITVKITCTSEASIEMTANEQTITCGFTVEENGISFSADGLENIFNTLTVEGDIETVLAGEDNITDEVIAKEDIDILASFGSSGYGSEFTYDSETNTATIVYTGSWSGRGIWGGYYGSGLDYTGYAGIQLIFSPVDPGYYQIQIEYNNETSTEEASNADPSTAKADSDNVGIQVDNYNAAVYLFLEFNYDYAVDDIKQIYLQNQDATTVTLTTAKILVNAEDGVTKVEGGTAPTSISSIQTKDTVEVARYNLMGQKISGAEKGINIIVYSDGSAKKVLVK